MEYGIQMYSLRDITDKDLAGAFKAVADMGYKTVETAGFFGAVLSMFVTLYFLTAEIFPAASVPRK